MESVDVVLRNVKGKGDDYIGGYVVELFAVALFAFSRLLSLVGSL